MMTQPMEQYLAQVDQRFREAAAARSSLAGLQRALADQPATRRRPKAVAIVSATADTEPLELREILA